MPITPRRSSFSTKGCRIRHSGLSMPCFLALTVAWNLWLLSSFASRNLCMYNVERVIKSRCSNMQVNSWMMSWFKALKSWVTGDKSFSVLGHRTAPCFICVEFTRWAILGWKTELLLTTMMFLCIGFKTVLVWNSWVYKFKLALTGTLQQLLATFWLYFLAWWVTYNSTMMRHEKGLRAFQYL